MNPTGSCRTVCEKATVDKPAFILNFEQEIIGTMEGVTPLMVLQ